MRMPKFKVRSASAEGMASKMRSMANAIRSNIPDVSAPRFDPRKMWARLPKLNTGAWRQKACTAGAFRSCACNSDAAAGFRKLVRKAKSAGKPTKE